MEEDSGFFSNEELETLMLFFLDQASILLDNANQCLLRLETQADDGEALNQLQRTLHTLKGDANSVGFSEIGTVAHKLEDLVALWGNVNSELTIEILDLLLFGIDALGDMLQRKRQWVHAPLEIGSILDRISKFVGKHSISKEASIKQVELAFELNEYQKLKIQKALEIGLVKLWKLEAYFDSDCSMHGAGLLILLRELNRVSDVIATFPDVEDDQIENVNKVVIILLSDEPVSIQKTGLVVGVISSTTVESVLLTDDFSSGKEEMDKNFPLIKNLKEVNSFSKISHETQVTEEELQSVIFSSNETIRPSSQSIKTTSNVELLRVSAEKVDLLMDLVGELIISRSMLNQVCSQLKSEFPKNPRINKLISTDSYISRLLGQLQKAVLEVRMISLDQTFNRFFRVVRDLARDSGKQVELSIVGEQTELDKRVVDTIYEPLLHLVRNAVDHGIEPIEERILANKKPQGKLLLQAYYQTDQVIIEITDDGRGINIEKLKQKALEKAIRTETELKGMKDQDAYDLMFLTGVSTAGQLTEISGRGVGMGVVKTVIANLKGSIEINSKLGEGTTFTLRLPLTLAIIRAMLFSIDERVFALPLASVLEIVRPNESEIKQIGNHKVFNSQDKVYSLVNMSSVLLGKEKEFQDGFILMVGLGERRIALMVEKVIGEWEIVVKAIDKQWINSDLVAGASILGDGRVVLIIDTGALFRRTNLAASAKTMLG